MDRWIEGNKVLIALVILVAIVIGGYVYYRSVKTDALVLQAKCADRATLFYKQGNYDIDSRGFSNSYINHWNKKLEKCFIQITSTSLENGFIAIDLFDAFEGKRYAVYIGHNPCDPASLAVLSDPKRCQFDSGNIWFDGNDARNPADYHVGFQGIAIGPGIGDENTLRQFLGHIQPFITE